MTPLAAASASTFPTGTALLLLALWALGYLIACTRWPWTACPSCHGAGRHRSPSGRNFRDCTRCRGRGRRLRTGRRIRNWTRSRNDSGR